MKYLIIICSFLLFVQCGGVEESIIHQKKSYNDNLLDYISSFKECTRIDYPNELHIIDPDNETIIFEYTDGKDDPIISFNSTYDLSVKEATESWQKQLEIWGKPEWERDLVYSLCVSKPVGVYYKGLRILRYADRGYDVVFFDHHTDTIATYNGEYPAGIVLSITSMNVAEPLNPNF